MSWWTSWSVGGGNCCLVEECHMSCMTFALPGFYAIITIIFLSILLALWCSKKFMEDK